MPRYTPVSSNPNPSSATSTNIPSNAGVRINSGSGNGNGMDNNPFYCSCLPYLFSTSISRFFQSLPNRMEIVGYTSGILFALGWWVFIDGIVYTANLPAESTVPKGVEDFITGTLSTMSLIIVNLIDKDALNADDYTFSGAHVASKARACAFVGVTIALGSLGGAFTILGLKYLVPGHTSADKLYFGLAIVAQNILIFIRFIEYAMN